HDEDDRDGDGQRGRGLAVPPRAVREVVVFVRRHVATPGRDYLVLRPGPRRLTGEGRSRGRTGATISLLPHLLGNVLRRRRRPLADLHQVLGREELDLERGPGREQEQPVAAVPALSEFEILLPRLAEPLGPP